MATEFKLPELGENIESGTVAKVLVKVGDTVAANQAVVEVETDKAVAEIPCPAAGKVTEIRVAEGQTVKAGDVMLLIEAGTAVPAAPAPAEEKPAVASSPPAKATQAPAAAPRSARKAGDTVLASPSVRRLARELGADLHEIPTADPSGRVTAQDVRDFAEAKAAAPAPADPPAALSPPPAALTAPFPATASLEQGADAHGAVAFEPLNTVRRKTGEHMTAAWTSIPHVTQFDKADITELEELRKEHAKRIEAAGGRLTSIAFIIKVVAEALKRFPKFNASLDLEHQRLMLKQYYNIGVAVDTPSGLLVPVIRDADRKTVSELAIELPALAQRARDRKLSLDDMQGGTFTITNLGGLGGTAFTPIINAPEVAILGVSRTQVEPVYQDGAFVPRSMLPLSLSYDHRVIDGADAARFARFLARGLEEAWTMLL